MSKLQQRHNELLTLNSIGLGTQPQARSSSAQSPPPERRIRPTPSSNPNASHPIGGPQLDQADIVLASTSTVLFSKSGQSSSRRKRTAKKKRAQPADPPLPPPAPTAIHFHLTPLQDNIQQEEEVTSHTPAPKKKDDPRRNGLKFDASERTTRSICN